MNLALRRGASVQAGRQARLEHVPGAAVAVLPGMSLNFLIDDPRLRTAIQFVATGAAVYLHTLH